MKKLIRLVFIVMLLSFVWYMYGNNSKDTDVQNVYEDIKSNISTFIDHPKVVSAIDTLQDSMDIILEDLNQVMNNIQKEQQQVPSDVEKIKLEEPSIHSFSIHNIELGDSREDVERQVGKAKRSTPNEYGVNWYTYHENYQNFFMVAYDTQDKVAGMYTNQDLITSKQGIKLGSSKDSVLTSLDEPVPVIQKGLVTYRIQNDGEYNLFQFDNSFVTIFYDKHEDNTVTAVQIISNELEKQKENFYPEETEALKDGFALQLFDLTNAARVEHGLPFLSWDEHVKETARSHSIDMAENHYFDHINLKGQSPFDRMKEDNITFLAAGENLAAGQISSIFAHEGLMNSLGHRENILHTDFESLGVGVAFDAESKPYFTENFLAN